MPDWLVSLWLTEEGESMPLPTSTDVAWLEFKLTSLDNRSACFHTYTPYFKYLLMCFKNQNKIKFVFPELYADTLNFCLAVLRSTLIFWERFPLDVQLQSISVVRLGCWDAEETLDPVYCKCVLTWAQTQTLVFFQSNFNHVFMELLGAHCHCRARTGLLVCICNAAEYNCVLPTLTQPFGKNHIQVWWSGVHIHLAIECSCFLLLSGSPATCHFKSAPSLQAWTFPHTLLLSWSSTSSFQESPTDL